MSPSLQAVPTTVPVDQTPLEYILLEAERNLQDGRSDVAITNLSHAVWAARTEPGDPISESRLRELVGRLVRAGGAFV